MSHLIIEAGLLALIGGCVADYVRWMRRHRIAGPAPSCYPISHVEPHVRAYDWDEEATWPKG